MKRDKPIVLILCGGQSLRLWPLTNNMSKNFLNIFGFSPLELTIKRFQKIAPIDNIFLIANRKEKKELSKLKVINKKNIFYEPESKNTAAAICLALNNLKKYPDQSLVISPVDHIIKKESKFYGSVNKALKLAKASWICTLGIKPISPTSDLGYIQGGKTKHKDTFKIKKFIEKPTTSLAKKLIRQGNCFYNSGLFITSIATLIEEYKKYYPFYNLFAKNISLKNTLACYKKISNLPFDKVIMEKTKKGMVVKANFFWKDFGNWNTVYDVLAKSKGANVKKGSVFIRKGKGNLIYLGNSKKKVLVLGLDDIFYIDTKDYTLLTNRNHLKDLKSVLKDFKQAK